MKKIFYLFICLFAITLSVFADNVQSDVSGKPRVITTTTVRIVKPNGETIEKQVSTSKLLTVQTTNTTVIKANGTVFNATTIGNVVGDVTHSSTTQKRVEVSNEILQGNTIEINGNDIIVNGVVATDVNGNKYSASSIIGSIYTVRVHTVNKQPTTIMYEEGDQIGSSNIVTYWINGKNTGISANLKITRTLVTATTTKTGTSIIKKQLFTQNSYPLTVTLNDDGRDWRRYAGTYTLNTTGENAGYYVLENATNFPGSVRFAAALSLASTMPTIYDRYALSFGYVTEFETKASSSTSWMRRSDYIGFSSNSFASMMFPVSMSPDAADGSSFSANQSGSVETNTGEYYFIDNVFTNIVAEGSDRITETYEAVDPAVKNEEVVTSLTITNIVRNGNVIVSGADVSVKEIKTVVKNGKTITGDLSYGNVVFARTSSKTAYGKTVSVKDGYTYFDGVNSGILDSEATYETKVCYYLDNKPTDVEYSSSDNVTSKNYYVENGEITEYEKLDSDKIETEEMLLESDNDLTEKTIEVTMSNGTTYKAVDAYEYVGRYRLNTSRYGSLYYSNKSTYTDDVITLNGQDVGRRSQAYFYDAQVPSGTTTDGSDSLYIVNGTNYLNAGTPTAPYYIPQFDGYYFINGGNAYYYNGNSIAQTGPSGYNFYKTEGSFFCGLYNGRFFLGRLSGYNSGSQYAYNGGLFGSLCNTITISGGTNILNATNLFLTYASLGNGTTRCVSCFNDESNSFISMAGLQGWGRVSFGVHTSSRKIYYGSGHITSLCTAGGINNYTFQKVCLLNSQSSSILKFLALDTGGRVWFIDYNNWTAVRLSIDGNAVITDIDTNRSGRGVAISQSGRAVYIINEDTSVIKYSTEYQPLDVVYGRSMIGVRTADNRLYTMDAPTSSTAEQMSWTLSPLQNVREIGVINNRVMAKTSTFTATTYETVPMVRVNGVEYRQSDLRFEAAVELYKLDENYTLYRVSPNDTSTVINYIRLVLENNQGTASILESDIDSVNIKLVSRAADGGILGILTTENGIYYLNGNNLNIQANVLDEIEMNSRKTYYIGNVNTGIEPEDEDDKIEIKGDYWEVNGHNTAVRYYGLGEMCVRVSDVTPGEITEDDTATASTVVVPLVVRAQIVRFNPDRPITSIKFQYRKLTDSNWTNLKELTNAKRKLETSGLQAIFGRYVEVPVSKSESFLVRVNISDGTESTVTASALEPEQGNVFYYSFIRSQKERVK